LPFTALLWLILAKDGEDWNRPECDIPGFRGKVSDAAIVAVPCPVIALR